MDSEHVHLWQETPHRTDSPAGPAGDALLESLAADADLLFQAETFARKRRAADRAAPFSAQWFLDIEQARYGRYARWIPHLLEFGKHAGETLLGVGAGLGTDWVQYARHGSRVIACSPVAEGLPLVQRNFESRGRRATYLHARPEALPVESASIDVVCLNDPVRRPDLPRVAAEAFRVLKPGGKVLAVFPARYDADFWTRRWLPWRLLKRRGDGPRQSARSLRRQFDTFAEHRVHKRHLRRADVPPQWRWLPLPVLERLFGQFLILKAFKPVRAAGGAVGPPLAA